jgi:hypothetical protein
MVNAPAQDLIKWGSSVISVETRKLNARLFYSYHPMSSACLTIIFCHIRTFAHSDVRQESCLGRDRGFKARLDKLNAL